MAKAKTPKKQDVPVTNEMTSKQAQVKIVTLLKGLNNDTVMAVRRQEQNAVAVKQIQDLLPTALTKTEKVAKVAKEKVSKMAKEKVSKVKVTKPVKGAIKIDERPSLKKVIHDVIEDSPNKSITASEIYKLVSVCGNWSRQSLYNALKDMRSFAKVGEEYKNVEVSRVTASNVSGEPDEADRFIAAVEATQSTDNVL